MYTIKVTSSDGALYVVNRWYKHKKMFVPLEELKASMLYQSNGSAKIALKRLFGDMPKSAQEKLEIVQINL